MHVRIAGVYNLVLHHLRAIGASSRGRCRRGGCHQTRRHLLGLVVLLVVMATLRAHLGGGEYFTWAKMITTIQ